MPDISMCANAECPVKAECYRYRAWPNGPYQTYYLGLPTTENGCSEFWDTSFMAPEQLRPMEQIPHRSQQEDGETK